MRVSFRYHVASIIGILFSLVLGILIGGALFQDDRLVKEQGLIIADLEGQFSQLKTSLAQHMERERVVRQSWVEVRGTLVQGLLGEQQVVLVSGSNQADWSSIKEVLTAAGAEVKEMSWTELESMDDLAETRAVFWVEDSPLGMEEMNMLQVLSSAGAHITFLQNLNSRTPFPELATSLCIDMADTFLGELALVFGLAEGAVGHYGVRSDAKGVFPEVLSP